MKILKSLLGLAAAICVLFSPLTAKADITDLLSGKVGDTLGNLVEGVLTKSDIEVSELAGVWTSSGSAVAFKGDNFLEKAGGVTAAAAVESQLNPYYKKYGLTGAVFTIDKEGNFKLKVKNLTLSGTITKNQDKTFNFNFKALGKVSIGKVKTYVEKGPKSLNIMFDATKLKQLISTIAGFSGNKLTSTAANLLDKYEGMCVGFKVTKTGNAPASAATPTTTSTKSTSTSTTKTSTSKTTSSTTSSSATDKLKQGAEALKNMLGGSSSTSKK